MTSTTLSAAAGGRAAALRWAVADVATMTWRNLTVLRRVPQLVVFATIQPIMFVLMFRYVFGGAIRVPGLSYADYLMPGVFVQTVVFGATNTGVGLAEDLCKGLVERFRSLPMARSAVLAGRTLADLGRNVFVVLLMVTMGYVVGFRVHTNALALAGCVVLLLLFGFAFSWVFAFIGLGVPNAESAQAAAFPLIFPLVFASSAFVPVASMPSWLRVFAENQPVTRAVDAARALVLGGPTAGKVAIALVWVVGILSIFVPLAVRRYRRTA